jgi:hypothetical protein
VTRSSNSQTHTSITTHTFLKRDAIEVKAMPGDTIADIKTMVAAQTCIPSTRQTLVSRDPCTGAFTILSDTGERQLLLATLVTLRG